MSEINTSSDFFEQEKQRQKEKRDRERARDLQEALDVGEEVEAKDQRWLDKYEAKLAEAVEDWAHKIAKQPRLGLNLTKIALNQAEDLQGKRAAIDSAFGYHHFAHAQNQLTKGDYIAGLDGKKMAERNKAQEAKG